jgi:FKBP-type peptidyl-prolyl cis-trans isomerase
MKTYWIILALAVSLVTLACQKEEKAAKEELDSLKESTAYQDAKAKEENDAFLAKNKTQEGVMTTESGLQYSVLQLAEGDKPGSGDKAVVSVIGTLIDGTEFENSAKAGKSDTLAVSEAIPGLAEALQLMSKGTKFKAFIPAGLAYGEKGNEEKKIGPHATLIYEIELLEIIKAVAAKKPGLTPQQKVQKAKKAKQMKMKKKKGAAAE